MLEIDWSKALEVLGNISGTLAATFLGAWFAFKWQRDKESLKEREKNIQSANLSLSLLAAQIINLAQIKAQLLRNITNPDTQHLTVPPIDPPENLIGITLPIDTLAFALEKEPTLIASLSSAQKDINTAIGLVRSRSNLHYEVVQPAVEELQKEYGGEQGPPDLPDLIAAKLGFRKNFEMKDKTDRMLFSLTYAHGVAKTSFAQLQNATLKSYPGAGLIPMPEI